MGKALEQEVRKRARDRCEYCLLPEQFSKLRFPLDHIIARQHGGSELSANLALACGHCNCHKGPNIAGIDAITKQMVRLFHPRNDEWDFHFRWNGSELIGLTDVGRATIVVLAMNHPFQIVTRRALMDEGVFHSVLPE